MVDHRSLTSISGMRFGCLHVHSSAAMAPASGQIHSRPCNSFTGYAVAPELLLLHIFASAALSFAWGMAVQVPEASKRLRVRKTA